MTREDLCITRNVLGDVYLHDGPTRHATLVQLAAAWAEDSTAVIDALDALAAVVLDRRAPEGAVDAAVEDVETAAGLDLPDVLLSRADQRQLLNQGLTAYQPPRRIPRPLTVVDAAPGTGAAA